ncbi:mitochondrial 54S ribosomal protein uL5m KNAG_0A04210 [Huiozyma naganishii CBS 8797]|uniref:Large ribosomal subunit protein uL5m n=1 Tax=Huiozyma naganishii (strain ATCC MYA-139 / BCRC 22969 / CBS 8797 / KCTC 17520 / NBRC 10181 / NCYC 3082 / Yp74L-3) TaxID=1071383 RepID=J7REW2_HUIN7|nr:hypothetical protein KNAG_0A04210 [Kazachstania naganishii CBS 8797]CCK68098.1 hypothetical protein KNAG_0A04210 [Kazachstania naganishii CBS 8797]
MLPGQLRGLVRAKQFSFVSTRNKSACSLVKPVHHLVKIDKSKLSPRFPDLQYEKTDIRSPAFRPTEVRQDRVHEHYLNTLQSDLLLINYKHNDTIKQGLSRRAWDESSPYHINRSSKRPRGSKAPLPNVHPVKWDNIPKIESIVINCFVKDARDNETFAIGAALQLQQITGCKPSVIYSKSDVPTWKIRKGNQMGAKVELTGLAMNQFLTTLTEIVLPRIREYKGISVTSGDTFGNIAFGLTANDVKFFPEIDSNQDLWPKTFGFHVTIKTNAETDDRARTLISAFQLPFNEEKSG